MSRRSRTLALLAAVAALAWWRWPTDEPTPEPAPPSHARKIDPGLAQALATARAALAQDPGTFDHPGPSAEEALGDPANTILLSGKVVDVADRQGVGPVEVVFASPAGEITATSAADGTYHVRVAPGLYRAFVRDDDVLSVGAPERSRLPGAPRVDGAGAPVDALLPTVVASVDTTGIDLGVRRSGVVTGRVVDGAGRPVAGVILRATNDGWRPVLATDVAETDAAGRYELRLPEGNYQLDAAHDRYAGLSNDAGITVEPRAHLTHDLTLVDGCVITGRVVLADGRPAPEGAIERRYGLEDHEFTPAGQIDPDGRFRWTTTDEGKVSLRAWPWKSPPSLALDFACRAGARFQGVVFTLPARGPTLEGVLVDHHGAPVPLAYVDVRPLDGGGFGQQERTDAEGRWQVFDLVPGRYHVSATAAGKGVVADVMTSPSRDHRLALGGTGRVEGTATIANGSFQIELRGCMTEGGGGIALAAEPRLVTVHGGRYAVDEVPACQLAFDVLLPGREPRTVELEVPADGVARHDLDVAPPRTKKVQGTIRDTSGRPVAGVEINAYGDGEMQSVVSDASGRYELTTVVGGTISGASGDHYATGAVSDAPGDAEQVDLVLHQEWLE